MELKDLKGWYTLTGVDTVSMCNPDCNSAYEEAMCNACNFILNGIVYQISEDPADGYRSYARDIKILHDGGLVSNTFIGAWVYAHHVSHREDCGYTYSNQKTADILELIDMISNQIVLTIGTDYSDDYYPYYVCDFQPENMAINQGR